MSDDQWGYVYRQGQHAPGYGVEDKRFHATCNVCLTDLDADAEDELAELKAAHCVHDFCGVCKTRFHAENLERLDRKMLVHSKAHKPRPAPES